MTRPDDENVPLRDLVIGEPAMQRILDGDAAREQAARFVREVAADPRLAAIAPTGEVETIAGPSSAPSSAPVEPVATGTEAERLTARMPPRVTSASLDRGAPAELTAQVVAVTPAAVADPPAPAAADPGGATLDTAPAAIRRRHTVLVAATLAVCALLAVVAVVRWGDAGPQGATAPEATSVPAVATTAPRPTAPAPAPAQERTSSTVDLPPPRTSVGVEPPPPPSAPSVVPIVPKTAARPARSAAPAPPAPSTRPTSDRPY